MIKRGKVRTVNPNANQLMSSYQNRDRAQQSSQEGIYGIGGVQASNTLNKMGQENTQIFKPGPSDNIKEVMNTSAPICISSYIKGTGSRPKGSVAANRRQASFNSTGTGFTTQPNRRGNGSGGAPPDLGIVAGQTMNLSRTKYRD